MEASKAGPSVASGSGFGRAVAPDDVAGPPDVEADDAEGSWEPVCDKGGGCDEGGTGVCDGAWSAMV